jgi:hypothetical protein
MMWGVEGTSMTFSEEQVQQAREVVSKAVADLGTLTPGQATDLLLDNLEWLGSCQQAKELVAWLRGAEADLQSAQYRLVESMEA